jgi:hypothetical protein
LGHRCACHGLEPVSAEQSFSFLKDPEIAGISLISRGKPRAQLVARKEAIRSKKKHIFRSHDDAILAPQRVQEPKKVLRATNRPLQNTYNAQQVRTKGKNERKGKQTV